jgi:hypothetical protein
VFVVTLLLWVTLGVAGLNVGWQMEAILSDGSGGAYYTDRVVSPRVAAVTGILLLAAVPGLTLLGAAISGAARALASLALPLLISAVTLSQVVTGGYYLAPYSMPSDGSTLFLSMSYESGVFSPLPLGMLVHPDELHNYNDPYVRDYEHEVQPHLGYVKSLMFLLSIALLCVAAYASTLAVERHRRGMP